jgi:hypothetical protein
MKTGFYVVLALLLISLTVNGALMWQIVDSAVTKDHLKVAVANYGKREVTLLRFARAFSNSTNNQNLRHWIHSHMSDLDVTEQGDQMIVNGVEIRLDANPATLE